MRFEFRVQNSDETIAAEQSLVLPDLASAWAEVVEIAHEMADIGGRIVVTNDAGEVVILAGVVEIISHIGAPKSAKPTLILRDLAVR
jgi:hypothetical protein